MNIYLRADIGIVPMCVFLGEVYLGRRVSGSLWLKNDGTLNLWMQQTLWTMQV